MSHHYLDQPRDDHGRWTDEGGGKTEIVTTIKDASAAIKAAASDYSKEALILEQALELNRKAVEATDEFKEKMKNVNAILNGVMGDVNLKKVERISEKAIKEYNGDVNSVSDPIRTTFLIENKDDYKKSIDAFWQGGAYKVKFQEGENFLGYTGVLAKFKMSNGIDAEMQANYPEMIYAKESPESAKRMIGEKKWNEIFNRTKLPGGLGHVYYENNRAYEDKIRKNTLTDSEREYLKDNARKSIEYYSHFK